MPPQQSGRRHPLALAAILPVALAASLLGTASGFACQPLGPSAAQAGSRRPLASQCLAPRVGKGLFITPVAMAAEPFDPFSVLGVREGAEPFDPFSVLGVREGADTSVIKTAFRRLSLRLHPDVSGSQTTDKFIRLVAAYKAVTCGAAARAPRDQGAAAEAWYNKLWGLMRAREAEGGGRPRRRRAEGVREGGCSPFGHVLEGAPLYGALEEMRERARGSAAAHASARRGEAPQWDAAVGAGGRRRDSGGRTHVVMVHGSLPSGGGWGHAAPPPGYAGLVSVLKLHGAKV